MSEEKQQEGKLEGMCPDGNFPDSSGLCKSSGDNMDEGKIGEILPEKMSKEEQEEKLERETGIKNTAAFRLASLPAKKEWLEYVIDNKNKPWLDRYQDTWSNWLNDRQQEVAQHELFDLFKVKKTADLRQLLADGEYDKFGEIIQYIIDNRDIFPQYNDNWFKDRERELKEAQG